MTKKIFKYPDYLLVDINNKSYRPTLYKLKEKKQIFGKPCGVYFSASEIIPLSVSIEYLEDNKENIKILC